MSDPSSGYRDLFRIHTEGHTKYLYFLLAVAASGIALAVNATAGSQLMWPQLPLGLAVASWGLSFYFGCRSVFSRNVLFGLNADILRLLAAGNLSDELRERMETSLNEQNREGARYMRWQFGYLIAGAVLYVVWHILEMALRTVSSVQ